MDIRLTPIESDRFYHIYNRGINGELNFKTKRNYLFFLNKIKDNLLNVCDIYAYCLMPNHFHLLVRIKSDSELENLVKVLNLDKVDGLHAPQHVFSKQFSNIFNSYSQAFNKENNRHGALIESPFKRKLISSEDYLRQCIIYIYQNPISEDFKDYPYSSYKTVISNSFTSLKRDEVIELFEDKENFRFCHKKETDYQF
ncbi:MULTISPECIES: transposase [unclassified Kaistella]|uniref:transposase n=1 Tax=unclassified Kaistella TaxID=2762626 RepID=UPI0027331163|nr:MULTISPECIES: transposase [unclassified Kaistella]MDP2453577.1 transposase [Kaistella sp. SH11-4b]MDP2456634.1 transposase [Kaistella sp. SH40-3]MDP2459390.1 transposase [Kaistella sp. SH19-2b]